MNLRRFCILVLLTCSSSLFAKPNNSVDFLAELMRHDTPTTEVMAINRVQALLQQKLERMGFNAELFFSNLGGNAAGQMLVAEKVKGSAKFITLLTFIDTKTSNRNGLSYQPGNAVARGAGAVNGKGGIVVAINGLTQFMQAHSPRFSHRLIVLPNKYKSAEGFERRLNFYAKNSILVLDFEGAAKDGGIIDSRTGQRQYHVKVRGTGQQKRLQHILNKIKSIAGVHPTGRINTYHSKYAPKGSVAAVINIEFDSKEIDRLYDREIMKYLESQPINTTYHVANYSPPIERYSLATPLLEAYRSLSAEIEGHAVSLQKALGNSESNLITRQGLVVIGGLGPVGKTLRNSVEELQVSSLDSRAAILSRFLYFANSKLQN